MARDLLDRIPYGEFRYIYIVLGNKVSNALIVRIISIATINARIRKSRTSDQRVMSVREGLFHCR